MIEYSWEEWDKLAWDAIDRVREAGRGDAAPESRGSIALLFSKYCKDKVIYDASTDTYSITDNFMKIIKSADVLLMKLVLIEIEMNELDELKMQNNHESKVNYEENTNVTK